MDSFSQSQLRCSRLIFWAFMTSMALLQSCTTSIQGRLVDPKGGPLSHQDARVNVLVVNSQNQKSSIIRVEADGSFVVPDVQKGQLYLIEALMPGYGPEATTVEVSDQSQMINLTLQKLPSEPMRSIRTNRNASYDAGSGGASLTPPSL